MAYDLKKLSPISEALVDLVWDSLDVVSVSRLADGRLLDINEGAADFFGMPREELIGRTSVELNAWTPEERSTFVKSLQERGRIDELPLAIRDASGETRVAHVSARLCMFHNEPAIVLIGRDTTESSRTERLLAVEHAVTRALGMARTLDQAAPGVLAVIGERLDWDLGVLWWEDPEADILRPLHIWQSPAIDLRLVLQDTDTRTFQRGEGLVGRVWERAEPIWAPDVPRDPRFLRTTEAEGDAVHAAMMFPVVADRRVRGVIEFYARQLRPPDDALLETLCVLGLQLGQFALGH
jgi:PAS domain S-box-containing protein